MTATRWIRRLCSAVVVVTASLASAYIACNKGKFASSAVQSTQSVLAASFRSYDLPFWLVDRCEKLGFTKPTLAQEIALPEILKGNDVILQSMTGSGKTFTFLLPILTTINPNRAAIQAVIVVPTRELGLQISSVAKQLSKGSPDKIIVMNVLEGSNNLRQQIWATAEPPHIVVGNPKSLQRLVDMGRLRLNSVSTVVIDEVDACLINAETRQELHTLLSRRLSNTFMTAEDLTGAAPNEFEKNLLRQRDDQGSARSPFRIHRQTIMCSATIPQRQHFAQACLKNGWTANVPLLLHVSPGELLPKQVGHEVVVCPKSMRRACLKFLLKKELQSWAVHVDADSGADAAPLPLRAIVFIDDDDNDAEVEELIRTVDSLKGVQWVSPPPSSSPSPSPSQARSASQRSDGDADIERRSPTSDRDGDEGVQGKGRGRGEGEGEGGAEAGARARASKSLFNRVRVKAAAADGAQSSAEEANTNQWKGIVASGAAEPSPIIETRPETRSPTPGPGLARRLSESMSLDQRAAALDSFRRGECRVLVASEVGARGLDIPETTHVFQMSLPPNVDSYLHRSGRTGRMGRRGKVITFVSEAEDFVVRRHSNELGIPIVNRVVKIVPAK